MRSILFFLVVSVASISQATPCAYVDDNFVWVADCGKMPGKRDVIIHDFDKRYQAADVALIAERAADESAVIVHGFEKRVSSAEVAGIVNI